MGAPSNLPPKLAALAEALGGVQGLADACGVKRLTIWRWGQTPPKSHAVRTLVNDLATMRNLRPPWPAKGARRAR